MKIEVTNRDALEEYKVRLELLEEYRKSLCDSHIQILAEVIDNLYLGAVKDFVNYKDRTHKLGFFKENVKSVFSQFIQKDK